MSDLSDAVSAMRTSGHGASPPLLIANPHAGRGRAGRELAGLKERLRCALGAVDVACTGSPGHAVRLAARAVADRRPLVVSFGGDGTLSEIVNGLVGDGAVPADALPRLGVLAAGTGGDFGKGLKLGRHSDEQMAAVTSGRTHCVDIGWIHHSGADGSQLKRLWVNVVSGGIGGLVDRYTAQAPAALPGFVAYAQATIHAIVTSRRVPLRCRALLPDGSQVERALHAYAVAICNGTTFGAGMRIAPGALLDDGLLDIVVFETRSKIRLVRRLHTLYLGTHLYEQGVSHFRCRRIELAPLALAGANGSLLVRQSSGRSSLGLFPLDIDGDAIGDVPLEAGLFPSALNVCVPEHPGKA